LVEAWCDSSNGVRTFNLANVKSANLVDEASVRATSPEVESITKATLRAAENNRFLEENSSQIDRRGDHFFIDIFQDEWLVRSALAEGGELVVESPDRIAARVAFLAEESLKNYTNK